MNVVEYIFWGSLAIVAYVYLVYPGLVGLLSRFFADPTVSAANAGGRSIGNEDEWPTVTIVIPAFRQERVILDRLERAVSQDYPSGRIEVIVGCNGAEDLTGDLVLTFDDSRVRLVQSSEQRGRAAMLNDCIEQANGEVIVICDATAVMQADVVQRLVRHFRRPQVGGVCGKSMLTDPTTGQVVDSLYRRLESMLMRCEARLGMLLQANGAVYAIRKQIYAPLPNDAIAADLFLAMQIHRSALSFLFDETAVAIEEIPATLESDPHRWLNQGTEHVQNLLRLCCRPLAGAFAGGRMVPRRRLLNPLRGGLAWAFLSHKALCWCCPVLLVAALLTNAVLSIDPFYLRVLLLHELIYLVAFTSLWFMQSSRRRSLPTRSETADDAEAATPVGTVRHAPQGHDDSWQKTVQAVGSEE